MKGETPKDWRESIYYHYHEYPSVHMVPRQLGIRTQKHKLIRLHEFDEWELYDLENDPDEITNQYNNPEYAALIEKLKGRLDDLREHYDDDSDISVQPKGWQERSLTAAKWSSAPER